jgi:hypothetical protein
MNIDTRSLDSLEFKMLSGTDFLVQMIRNRLCVNSSQVQYSEVCDYLDSHCESNYYIRREGYKLFIYFEQLRDRDSLVQFLNQYSNISQATVVK